MLAGTSEGPLGVVLAVPFSPWFKTNQKEKPKGSPTCFFRAPPMLTPILFLMWDPSPRRGRTSRLLNIENGRVIRAIWMTTCAFVGVGVRCVVSRCSVFWGPSQCGQLLWSKSRMNGAVWILLLPRSIPVSRQMLPPLPLADFFFLVFLVFSLSFFLFFLESEDSLPTRATRHVRGLLRAQRQHQEPGLWRRLAVPGMFRAFTAASQIHHPQDTAIPQDGRQKGVCHHLKYTTSQHMPIPT